jgi:two-component system response regulator CpxR
MNRLLVVDDDRELCELLEAYLRREGFEVECRNDPAAGLEAALSGRHDLVVLDVMMPGMSGFDVLRRIRAASRVPVMMLTARGEEVDRIVGLEVGADDYLPKPFNSRELVARIRAILRRSEPEALGLESPARLAAGDVVLDPGTRTVARGGKPVDLTSAEFSVLEALMRAAGQVLSREEIARQALGRGSSSYDRSVDVHVGSVRRKLGPAPGGDERIKTVRNAGYLYVPAPAPEDRRAKR